MFLGQGPGLEAGITSADTSTLGKGSNYKGIYRK